MTDKATWSPRRIYLYLVCLITLVMMIVAAVSLARAVVELAYPEPGFVYPIRVPSPVGVELEVPEIDEKQLQEQREAQRRSAQRRAVISLVGNATMLLVAGPLYRYHWRKIEKGAEVPMMRGQPDST